MVDQVQQPLPLLPLQIYFLEIALSLIWTSVKIGNHFIPLIKNSYDYISFKEVGVLFHYTCGYLIICLVYTYTNALHRSRGVVTC